MSIFLAGNFQHHHKILGISLHSSTARCGKTNPLPAAAQDWNDEHHDYFFFDGKEGDLNGYRSKWGGVELNHANEDFCNKIYKDKDSYLHIILLFYRIIILIKK